MNKKIFTLLLLLCSITLFAVSLRDQYRTLNFSTENSQIKKWLVCGPFSFAGTGMTATEAADNDFLLLHGAEAGLRPVSGMVHHAIDGSEVTWKKFESLTGTIFFSSAFPELPEDNSVWYACTNIQRKKAGSVILTINSNVSSIIYVNGREENKKILRTDNGYFDMCEVQMKAGDNVVMIKLIQQKTGGNFLLGILEPSQAETQEAAAGRISPSIVSYDEANNELSILTDDKRSGLLMIRPDVKVEILTPGWNKLAEKTAPRGEYILFDTKDLPEGIFELRCTSADLEGKPVRAYLMWYKGNPIVTAKKIQASTVTQPNTDTDYRKNLLAQVLADRLGADLTKVKADAWFSVYNIFMEYEELMMDDGGKTGSEHGSGFVRLSYIDETDGSPQFCRAYLPPDFDQKKKYPMVVVLHGRSDEFPAYIKWGGIDQRHDGMAEKYNAIVIYPHARGNSWYRGIGDNDVTQCIDLATNNLPVDESRIYLKGYSMGGAGVWYYGSRHPEKFAAIVPFFGGYDFRFQLNDESLAKLNAKSQFRRERLSYIGQIEALNNTPVFASHGDADTTVPVDYSRYTVKLMQSWGYNVRYWEHPGEGHGGLNEEPVNKWIFEQKKITDPKRVRVRSASLRYAQAYWVTVNQRKDPYSFVRAEVDVISSNYIKVLTENVLQITLAPPMSIVQINKLIKVVWNDEVRIVMPENGKIVLSEKDYKPVGIIKTSETEGPANDIFCTPFALVVGTQSVDPLMNAACSAAAKRFAVWWDERFHTSLRIYKDTEIDDFAKSDYSLILFGWIGENALAKDMSGKVPLTVTNSLITVDTGKFRIRDAGIQMIYPNPFNPYRYILIRAGSSPQGLTMTDYAANDTDFSIVDSRNMDINKNGGFFDIINGRNSGNIIVCGYFDNNWKYQEKNIEKDWLSVIPPTYTWSYPKYATIQKANEFYLSDLIETSADGAGNEILRNSSFKSDKIIIGKNRYDHGISFPGKFWIPKRASNIEYNIANGGYNRLRAVIGLDYSSKATGTSPAAEKVVFEIEGDGIVLYTSEPFGRDTVAKNINVDITGVKNIKLKVKYGAMPAANLRAINWADIKLTK